MQPDMKQYLLDGEELMWEGQSHKEGPDPSSANRISTRVFSIIWLISCCAMFSIPIFVMQDQMQGKEDKIALYAFAAIFILVGVVLFISSFKTDNRYYALTDRRFLEQKKDGTLLSHELRAVIGTQFVGIKNGYGTIVLETGDTERVYRNKHWRTVQIKWYLKGVEEPNKVFQLVNNLIEINHSPDR